MNNIKMVSRRSFSRPEREVILQKTNHKCAHCGRKLDTFDMTVDHVFPINKGGLHDEYNLLPLCLDCNEKKSNFVYMIGDYYKHIREDELEKFRMYFAFASFEYSRKSIIGYDEMTFDYVPEKYNIMLMNMVRRGKIDMARKTREKIGVRVFLRKAYPASAPKVFEMIQKHVNNPTYRIDSTIYPNEYSVQKAITEGVVYLLETADNNLCGVFMYERVANVYTDLNIMQLNNILDETGLKLKFIMTFATINNFAMPLFSEIMTYLDESQLSNGWLPMYFNLVDKLYYKPSACIKIPYGMCGFPGTIEFMQLKEIIENETYYCRYVFEKNGYIDVPDYDIRQFAEYQIRNSYQSEFDGNAEAEAFFEKYPLMKLFFKPDSYELYDVGFVTPLSG